MLIEKRETQKWYSCRWQVNHLSSLQYFDAAPTVICNRRDTREIEYTCWFMRKKIKNSLILRKFSKLWAILGKKIVVSRVSISLEIIGNCLSHSVILICDECKQIIFFPSCETTEHLPRKYVLGHFT